MAGATALFNGNISQTTWRSASDNQKRTYWYDYDDLNRLKKANYLNMSNTNIYDTYNEEIDYDKNGNIVYLDRFGGYENYEYTFPMDKLTYEYDENSNRLLKVTDTSGSIEGFKDGNTSGDDYDYDEFGNMIQDKNKDITSISYNHLNLPTRIVFGTGAQIWYTYDAGGVKQAKKVQDDNEVTYTDYLDGFQYVNEELQFIPHAEGYVKVTFDKSGNPHYNYIYQYKDHLGNIRLNYTKNLSGELEILDENHYYPFGLEHTYYNTDKKEYKQDIDTDDQVVIVQVADRGYDYKYNGKELQDELGYNVYDFDKRHYDPAIGRWLTMDPLAEQMRRHSPYNYAFDNPVYFIDPDGMENEGFDWKKNKNGTYTAEKGDSAASLAKDANISPEKANELVESQLGKNYKGADGEMKSNVEVGDVVSIPEQVEAYEAEQAEIQAKEVAKQEKNDSIDKVEQGLMKKLNIVTEKIDAIRNLVKSHEDYDSLIDVSPNVDSDAKGIEGLIKYANGQNKVLQQNKMKEYQDDSVKIQKEITSLKKLKKE